jgi:hypothetical protein
MFSSDEKLIKHLKLVQIRRKKEMTERIKMKSEIINSESTKNISQKGS